MVCLYDCMTILRLSIDVVRSKGLADAGDQDRPASRKAGSESARVARQMPPMHRYLVSRYSSMPYFEPSRPRPDCLMPPNGATSFEIRPVLMPTIPYSSASDTRQTRARSRL